jgi:hypothetical protein
MFNEIMHIPDDGDDMKCQNMSYVFNQWKFDD